MPRRGPAARAKRIEAMKARRAGNVTPVRPATGLDPAGRERSPRDGDRLEDVLALSRTSGSSIGMIVFLASLAVMAMIISSQGNGFATTLGFFALGMTGFSC